MVKLFLKTLNLDFRLKLYKFKILFFNKIFFKNKLKKITY